MRHINIVFGRDTVLWVGELTDVEVFVFVGFGELGGELGGEAGWWRGLSGAWRDEHLVIGIAEYIIGVSERRIILIGFS
jgi:hypothetical protein